MGKLYLAILSMAFKDSSDREIRWSSKVFTIFLVLAVVGRTETMRILEKYNNNFPDTLILLQLIESTFVATCFPFAHQSCLDNLSQASRNSKKITSSWKANLHSFSHRRLLLCHLNVKNVFCIFDHMKSVQKTNNFFFYHLFIFIICNAFHRSY